MSSRVIRYQDAILEAQNQILASDPRAYMLGLGADGPTGVFGTTSNMVEQFGRDRVVDMPASENAMTGIALGTALMGRRPIMVHMRMDFAILALRSELESICITNVAPKGYADDYQEYSHQNPRPASRFSHRFFSFGRNRPNIIGRERNLVLKFWFFLWMQGEPISVMKLQLTVGAKARALMH